MMFRVSAMPVLCLIFVSALASCAPRGRTSGGGGDDDDDASADDDATGDDDVTADDDTTADDDDSTSTQINGPEEDLSCSSGGVDVWSVNLNAGDDVVVRADTISASTTFDPAFTLYVGDSLSTATEVGSADDEFPCTFPPPDYSCPEFSSTAEVSGPFIGAVRVVGNCAGSIAEYEIEVTVNGAPRTPTLQEDDYVIGS